MIQNHGCKENIKKVAGSIDKLKIKTNLISSKPNKNVVKKQKINLIHNDGIPHSQDTKNILKNNLFLQFQKNNPVRLKNFDKNIFAMSSIVDAKKGNRDSTTYLNKTHKNLDKSLETTPVKETNQNRNHSKQNEIKKETQPTSIMDKIKKLKFENILSFQTKEKNPFSNLKKDSKVIGNFFTTKNSRRDLNEISMHLERKTSNYTSKLNSNTASRIITLNSDSDIASDHDNILNEIEIKATKHNNDVSANDNKLFFDLMDQDDKAEHEKEKITKEYVEEKVEVQEYKKTISILLNYVKILQVRLFLNFKGKFRFEGR
jgi:hypothetical protein